MKNYLQSVQPIMKKRIVRKQYAILKTRSYLQARSMSTTQAKFNENDMIRIQKGLYYNMWMCDKQIVQEDLAEKISSLVFCFNNDERRANPFFIQTYFKTIMKEWGQESISF